MTRRFSGLLIGVAAAGVAALSCKSDPTSSLTVNTPAAISTNVSLMVVSQGDTAAFQASVVNPQLVPLTVPVSFAACTGTVGTVAVTGDTSYHPPVANKFQARVAGVVIGPACVAVTGGGLVDTVDAAVAPIVFTGLPSDPAPAGGSTITIPSTSLLKFSSSPVVTFGGGIAGTTAGATPDLITVVVPFSDSGALKIDSIAPTYIATNEYELSTTSGVKQTGDFWVGDSSVATAPTITLPAAGAKGPMITNLYEGDNHASCPDGSTTGYQGPCMYYHFAVAETTTVKFSADWDGLPNDATDLDIFACDAATVTTTTCGSTPESGKGGKTHGSSRKRPEEFTFTFPAGDHYFVVSRWTTLNPTTTVPPRNVRVTITTRP